MAIKMCFYATYFLILACAVEFYLLLGSESISNKTLTYYFALLWVPVVVAGFYRTYFLWLCLEKRGKSLIWKIIGQYNNKMFASLSFGIFSGAVDIVVMLTIGFFLNRIYHFLLPDQSLSWTVLWSTLAAILFTIFTLMITVNIIVRMSFPYLKKTTSDVVFK